MGGFNHLRESLNPFIHSGGPVAGVLSAAASTSGIGGMDPGTCGGDIIRVRLRLWICQSAATADTKGDIGCPVGMARVIRQVPAFS